MQPIADTEQIEIYGARVHNLKNIDLIIPRNQLVVITGLSGSGKSSLAFDTLYAEGQRRYMESFSAYARQFIGTMERPDVDKIEGLSPVISIEQKSTNRNPRSTVGTVTEIYDLMRLLYAKIGVAESYISGKKMIKQTDEQILRLIKERYNGKNIAILAPLVKGRKGHYRELFEEMRKKGYLKIRIDGEITDLEPKMQIDRFKIHDIELVVDRLQINQDDSQRLTESFRTALKMGKGIIQILNYDTDQIDYFSTSLMDIENGLAYDEPQPNNFSFNSPYGWCQTCQGLGVINEISPESVMPDTNLSINEGGLDPLGTYRDVWIFKILVAVAKRYKFLLSTPIKKLEPDTIQLLLYGTPDYVPKSNLYTYNDYAVDGRFEGVITMLKRYHADGSSDNLAQWAEKYITSMPCKDCQGQRLNQMARSFTIKNTNISELTALDISELNVWFNDITATLSEKDATIANEIVKEIKTRLGFLENIGLNYLALNRNTGSLSGGEAQRIRLATQIGTELVGVLYILDEPSIGLHQRDNHKLINSLKNLASIGNSVLVVEHDRDIMLESDFLIDIGDGAGRFGGKIINKGTPKAFLEGKGITADYLSNRKNIEIPKQRRAGNGQVITLKNATGNNLKNVSVDFPLGKLICVTGVSGSGKSTLINETLYPILSQYFYRSKQNPLPYTEIVGLEHVDKVIQIDQDPIGRTTRSNPATYTGVFTDIRNLYANMPEAKIRGYKAGRFSFNVKGGRCETCQGAGIRLIEMNFLPDVTVPCESCQSRRYNRETLEVRFKGKSINDVLNMSISDALVLFEAVPSITRKIQTLQDVGLGYLTLGQSSTTISGGEAQRVKLASELSKKDTGKTFYILDEPTTGLHFEDIKILLEVLQRLANKGNTVLVIEHNMDVVKVADWVIDVGPEGGKHGGKILFEGTPEQLAKSKIGYTAPFVKAELKR